MDVPKTVCNKRFRIGESLGKGTYGEVFQAVDETTGRQCAVKLEPVRIATPQLMYEAKVMKVLQQLHGVPAFLWAGADRNYNALAMQLLGCNFDHLLTRCNGRFSLKTTLCLAEQMIQRLESVHELSYIHRDIKPENFAVGLKSAKNFVYIFDFGLAKKYRDPRTHQHIPYRENLGLIGTVRYASVHAHMGMELSRRDDLESLMYMLIFFVQGSLPWQGASSLPKLEKYQKILQSKQSTAAEDLCKGLPQEFTLVLRYVRALLFDTKPDYSYLRRLMRACFTTAQLSLTPEYDWNTAPEPATVLLKKEKSRKSDSVSRGSQTTRVIRGPSLKREVRERLRRLRSADYVS